MELIFSCRAIPTPWRTVQAGPKWQLGQVQPFSPQPATTPTTTRPWQHMGKFSCNCDVIHASPSVKNLSLNTPCVRTKHFFLHELSFFSLTNKRKKTYFFFKNLFLPFLDSSSKVLFLYVCVCVCAGHWNELLWKIVRSVWQICRGASFSTKSIIPLPNLFRSHLF